MRSLTFPILDYTGGKNDVASPVNIGDNQSPDLQNVWLDEKKSISKQESGVLQSTLPEGTAVTGLWEYRDEAGSIFFIATSKNGAASKIFYSSDGVTWLTARDGMVSTTSAAGISAGAGVTVTPASMNNIRTSAVLVIDEGTALQEYVTVSATGATTFTATFTKSHLAGFTVKGNVLISSDAYLWEGVTFKTKFWMVNGNNSMLVFDGTDWLPAATCKAAINAAAGLLTGHYLYAITFTYIAQEYVFAVSSWKVSPTNQKVDLSKIPLGIPGSTKRTIYRTDGSGAGTFKKVDDILDNTTTTFLDNIADAARGADMPATYQSGPPVAKYPVVHLSSLVLLGLTSAPESLTKSDLDMPYCFSNANGGKTEILPLQGDTLWGGMSDGDTLLMFTNKNTWRMDGDGVQSDFSITRSLNGIGTSFHRSLQHTYHYGQQIIPFLTRDAIYGYNGTRDPLPLSENSILNTVRKLLQAEVQSYGVNYNTQTEWESMPGGLDANLDAVTNTPALQLAEDATLSAQNYDFSWVDGQVEEQILSNCYYTPAYLQWKSPNDIRCQPNPGNVARWRIRVNFQPTVMDHLTFSHQEIASDGTNPVSDFYHIYGITQYGETVFIGDVTISGVPATPTFYFTKNTFVGLLVSAQAHNNVSTYPTWTWLIFGSQYGVTQYKTSGTWRSPVIDFGASAYTHLDPFYADYAKNNQILNFGFRAHADPTTLLTWPFSPINSGDTPNRYVTARYGQFEVQFKLAGEGTLPALATAKTYPANSIPSDISNMTDPASVLYNPYPFTLTGTAMKIITDTDQFGATLHVLYYQGGPFYRGAVSPGPAWVPLNNATGWTVEIRYKLVQPGVTSVIFVQGRDGAKEAYAVILSDTIQLYTSTGMDTYSFSSNDGRYHTVRMTLKAGTVSLYADNILLGTAVPPATADNMVIWGGTNGNFMVDYFSWDDAGERAPSLTDNTTTPILTSLAQSWRTSSTGFFPVTTVASAFFRRKYWLAATYNSGAPSQNYNNIVLILDKNQAWVVKADMFAGAMCVFNDRLWWGDSRNANIYRLNTEPTNDVSSTIVTYQMIARYYTKKFNFGTNLQKIFFQLRVRYRCTKQIAITAYVDDAQATKWLLSQSDGSVETVLGFESDGTQNGIHLQLLIENWTGGLDIPDFEVYNIEVDYWLMKPGVFSSNKGVIQ